MNAISKTVPSKEALNIINNQLKNELINSRIDIFIKIEENIMVKRMIELIYSNIDKEFQKKLYDNKENRSEFYISLIKDRVPGEAPASPAKFSVEEIATLAAYVNRPLESTENTAAFVEPP